ncbi:MAG TPA: hypothetical protein VH417_10255 [Vicinamibacterales bacterium]|jgi:hypothetical protein
MLTGPFPRAVVAALLIVASREVSAQEPLAGPPDALPPLKPPAVLQRADFGLSVYQGFDRLVATDETFRSDPRFLQDSGLSSVNGTLGYNRHSHDVDFAVSGGGDLRYYTVVPDMVPVDLFGSSSVSSRFTRRTRVHAGGSVSYSPYYSFGGVLEPRSDNVSLLAPSTEQNVARLDTLTYDLSGGLTWVPTRKSTVDFSYTGNFVDTDAFTYRSFTNSVNSRYSYRTTRYSTFHAGYGLRNTQLGGFSRRMLIHDIDVGFGYGRPLSFSRHTFVGFSVGSSLIDESTYNSFVVTGEASLTHQLTRRWLTSAYYRRDVDAFAGALDLFVTDSVSGSVTGAFSRKVTFSANGAFSSGRLANGITNGYQSASGGSRLSYLVTRHIPIYVEYVFYHYDFDRTIGLAPGFPLLTTRHGLRVGMSYNVPLMGRRTR